MSAPAPLNTQAPVEMSFDRAGRMPAEGDNAAIAIQRLEKGTTILAGSQRWHISHTVLEGHRFATVPVPKGRQILSWGLPFGRALKDIYPGDYLCNEKILRALRERHVPFELPAAPNFADDREDFRLDELSFQPGLQVPRANVPRTFLGYLRGAGRGAGTRNYVVLMGTTSRSGAFVRALADRFRSVKSELPNIDGVVPVDHTEGGSSSAGTNRDLVVRTLAGFATHPNVGALLCVDFGFEAITIEDLRAAIDPEKLRDLPHQFFRGSNGIRDSLDKAEQIVRTWLPTVNSARRTELPLAHLKLGLQCGGSDAFSGVSANPLVGILSREVVAQGGSANLAETSELIGAERYVLANVRDLATAKKFLEIRDRFQEWAGWHGHSAEGNPSGGNMYRGLYNISIKSIGAARKKDPATRLDYAIDYSEPMIEPGFYFMNSPGNDLESIAGQVGSGCNLILFATGNGSITNFPFVPTIKIMTTTPRFELVRNEMDFNAGRYLDGEPLETLGTEAFEQMIQVASGTLSAGEKGGHAQVQLWREWRKTGPKETSPVEIITGRPFITAKSVPRPHLPEKLDYSLFRSKHRERIGLILPTSLCSGQVARMIAESINASLATKPNREVDRVVTLPHTEGCGNSAGESEQLFLRTMANYLVHPFVAKALLLEHGCEKTHNDAFRNSMAELGIPEKKMGWASIQMDGGIDQVTKKINAFFDNSNPNFSHSAPLVIGFYGEEVPRDFSDNLENVWIPILSRGGSIITAENSNLEGSKSLSVKIPLSIRYGERINQPGFHIMECPTTDPIETLTGLGAAGATVLMTYSHQSIIPGHPMIPTLQIAMKERLPATWKSDVDYVCERVDEEMPETILELIGAVREGQYQPKSSLCRNLGFQVTRGFTGISL